MANKGKRYPKPAHRKVAAPGGKKKPAKKKYKGIRGSGRQGVASAANRRRARSSGQSLEALQRRQRARRARKMTGAAMTKAEAKRLGL